MSSYPREGLESQASQGRIKGMKLPHVGLIRSSPWDQMEEEVLGSRVWRRTWEGESSGRRAERAGTVTESLGLRERFKCCGTQNNQLGSHRSDRVAHTGQTGLGWTGPG